MDFVTYSKIRAYCWQDMQEHINTEDRETLRRFRAKNEDNGAGYIRHEAIEAQQLFLVARYLKPRESAAAYLLANISNLYLETTKDLLRVRNTPPPLDSTQLDLLKKNTLAALEDYALFLPEREANGLMSFYGATASVPVTEPAKHVTAMKKAALIDELQFEWPSIETDISDATRNGLKNAAHTGKHGEWDRDRARKWAVSKGKIKRDTPVHSVAAAWSGVVTRHTISDR